jgi:hypothetical protein
MAPSKTGNNGDRDQHGRFQHGNQAAKGNPVARRQAHFRRVVHEAVSDEELRGVVQALVQQAKQGDVSAARELLTRLCGREPYPAELEPTAIDAQDYELARRLRAAKPNAAELLMDDQA